MNKTLLIAGGVAAIGIVGYMLYKKKESIQDASIDPGLPTNDAESGKSGSIIDAQNLNTGVRYVPSNTKGGLGTSPVGGSKGGGTPSTTGGVTINTGRFNGITDADFLRMEQARKDAENQNPYPSNASEGVKRQTAAKIKAALVKFAQDNKINYYAYTVAFGKTTNVSNFCNETDSFAFTLSF